MIEDYKFWVALIAVLLTLYAYIPYIKGILSDTGKPHLFTWLIWSITGVISSSIQIKEGGGTGCLPSIVTTLCCFYVMFLAVKCGNKNIKPVDYIFLFTSLSAIPLWVLTNNPMWSALLVTGISILASFPTIRKSWNHPEQEVLSLYSINIIKYALNLMAFASISISIIASPLGMIFMNGLIFGILVMRRNTKRMKQEGTTSTAQHTIILPAHRTNTPLGRTLGVLKYNKSP